MKLWKYICRISEKRPAGYFLHFEYLNGCRNASNSFFLSANLLPICEIICENTHHKSNGNGDSANGTTSQAQSLSYIKPVIEPHPQNKKPQKTLIYYGTTYRAKALRREVKHGSKKYCVFILYKSDHVTKELGTAYPYSVYGINERSSCVQLYCISQTGFPNFNALYSFHACFIIFLTPQ